MSKEYVVYRLISPSNKVYVGKTSRFKGRMVQHKNQITRTKLSLEIVEYGFENFKKEILESFLTEKQADEKEKMYIKKFNSIYPNGLNMQTGGVNCKQHYLTKNTISKSGKGRKHSSESKEKMKNDHTRPMLGKTISKKGREKISQTHKGKIISQETRKKMSNAQKGSKSVGAKPLIVNDILFGSNTEASSFMQKNRSYFSNIRKFYFNKNKEHPKWNIFYDENGILNFKIKEYNNLYVLERK